MYCLKVTTLEYGDEETIEKRFKQLKSRFETGHTCIDKIVMLDDTGEILKLEI